MRAFGFIHGNILRVRHVNEEHLLRGQFQERVRRGAADEEMKRVDRLGAFHEDDEAGTTFAMLKDVVEKLHKEFNAEKKEEEQ